MIVVMAEKPSVGQSIASVIGATTDHKADGYMEGNGYKVTWAYGHLVGLVGPDYYLGETTGGWKAEDLPIIPESFVYEFNGDGNAKKQYNNIKKLFNEADEIVCATDAGREGEAIFRYIYDSFHISKPVKRLWISSLTDQAIKEGFDSLQPGENYANLYTSAKARNEADWLIGMNGTRALSIIEKGKVSVGRVQTPTLGMIVKRFDENKNFTPVPYFMVKCQLADADGKSFLASFSDRYEKKEDAENFISGIPGTVPVGQRVESEVKEKAPLPFDITSLQAEANKKYHFKAQKTLDIVQALYEAKKVTYPRTGSRYMGDDMLEVVAEKVGKLGVLSYSSEFATAVGCISKETINKSPFDSSKLTDHHAIIPTFENVTDDVNDFGSDSKKSISAEDERKIYQMIAKQLVMSLMPVCVKNKLVYKFQANGKEMSATGVSVKEAGWRAISGVTEEPKEGEEDDKQSLPDMREGDMCSVQKKDLLSKMTQRPALLTEATLLKMMEAAGNYIEGDDSKELSKAIKDCGLGTPATRAAIIETLFNREYIANEKNSLVPTEKGKALWEIVKDSPLGSVKMTGEWESKLNKMAEGDYQREVFDNEIKDFTKAITKEYLGMTASSIFEDKSKQHAVVGKCPVCGGDVISGKNFYICKNWKKDDADSCQFMFKKILFEKAISEAVASELLEKKISPLISGFKSKGGVYSAYLVYKEDEKRIGFKMPDRKVIGKCPICGADVVEFQKSYSCSKYKETGCSFTIWKEHSGATITEGMVKQLLEKGETADKVKMKSKAGKDYSCKLKLDADHKLVNDMEEEPAEKKVIGKCPVCGKDLLEGRSVYFCSGWSKENPQCNFKVFRTEFGRTISEEEVKELIEKKRTGLLKGFVSTKTGKKYDAHLILNEANEVKLEFENKK
jgi:DNA topoisomerase-3